MVSLKSRQEIEFIRESALIVSRTLGRIAEILRPGITPLELDQMAEAFIREQGAKPAFKGLYGFPNTLCISVNDAIVHGIPNERPLEEGDIVSIDCGALKNGFYGDHAYTFAVGEVSPRTAELLNVSLECLQLGCAELKVGNRIGNIGFAVQRHAEKHGFGVVREYVGHGLGRELHEDPQVPNFGKKRNGIRVQNGLVLAIEPMINQGTHQLKKLADGWTVITADGLPSAHFEHNVAVIDGKPEILSTFRFIEEALGRSTPAAVPA